jgi:hypothetical protein
MRAGMRRWAPAVIALGAGAVIGSVIGRTGLAAGAVVVVLGLVCAIAGAGATPTPEQAAKRAARAEEIHARRLAAADRPGIAALGPRVEQVLRLAEEQADELRAKATQEAAQIVAAARAQADRIIAEATAGTDRS